MALSTAAADAATLYKADSENYLGPRSLPAHVPRPLWLMIGNSHELTNLWKD